MPQAKSKNVRLPNPTPKPKVETITVQIPMTGKPFKSFKDVIEAYHGLGEGYGADFLQGNQRASELEISDLIAVLIFLHRLMAWDATSELQRLEKIILSELSKG